MSTYEPLRQGGELPSLAELVRNLFNESVDLLRQHIELGKTELREDAGHWGQVAALLLGGVLLIQTFLIFLGITVWVMLEEALLLEWQASLLVTLAFLLGAVAALGLAWRQINRMFNSKRRRVWTLPK